MTQVLAPVGGGSNIGEAITLADSGYMVVWTHLVTDLLPIPNVTDELATAVLGRVFNADGTPRGAVFQVNQSIANSGQGQADLALLPNGNVAVVWTDGPNLTDFDVAARGRILSPTGAAVTDEFELSGSTQRDQHIPQVAANDTGGFFATWSDGRDPWSNTNEQWIGQEFDASGNRVGAELWIRDDRSSEDSELVHLNDGFYALLAKNGRTFNSDERFTYLGDVEGSTNFTGNATGAGTFGSGAATDGNGHVAVARALNYGTVQLGFYAPETIRNAQRGSFSDGTPFAETITGLNGNPEAIGNVNLRWLQNGDIDFTPSSFHAPSTALAYMPDGNLAVVWTGVSGGNVTVPEFSVYVQIVSPEGIILSDLQVIADQNVVGSSLAPPFVSAGADGKLFIGWTGTTARNGAGTNEVMGGVFDIPTYAQGTNTPSGTLATDGADRIIGAAPVDYTPTPTLYLMDGDDVWTQGAATQTQGVYGMNGNDRFILTDPTMLGDLRLSPGLGRDILDLSTATTAYTDILSPTVNLNTSTGGSFEVVIGTPLADMFRAPEYLNTNSHLGGPLPEGAYLHTEAGNDTIQFSQSSGGGLDGGDGFDIMTTYSNRASFELTFHGDHYTMGYLSVPYGSSAPPSVRPENVLTLRGIEEIQFGDETVTLQATASVASGGVADGPLPTGPINGTVDPETLNGTSGADTINGFAGDDTVFGKEGNDTIFGGDGNDMLYGEAGNDDIHGGANFDTIFGGDGGDTIAGDDGRDLVYLNQGNDLYNDNAQGGELGQDTVYAGYGDDTIQGGNGNDVFHGEWGADLIFARLGDDLVYGGDQFDTIFGGEGNDTVDGGNGRDLIYLNQGNDLFIDNSQGGELGQDTVFAGYGDDTIQGGNGNDVFWGEWGNDVIFARLGNDTVYAGDGFDFVDAGDGDDLVFAGNGRDTVVMGAGNDVYVDTAQTDELGQDTITGGAGADRFEFQAVMSADVITDFELGIDKLRLTQSLWDGGLTAAQVVSTYAAVTNSGVLLDFGTGQSILLQGLTSTTGLESDILLG